MSDGSRRQAESWRRALLFTAFGGSYPAVGTAAALIYGLGMVAIWWAPDTDPQVTGLVDSRHGTSQRSRLCDLR